MLGWGICLMDNRGLGEGWFGSDILELYFRKMELVGVGDKG